jgi:hypothetical protein
MIHQTDPSKEKLPETPAVSLRQVSQQFHVSDKSVTQARDLLGEAADLASAVESSATSLASAHIELLRRRQEALWKAKNVARARDFREEIEAGKMTLEQALEKVAQEERQAKEEELRNNALQRFFDGLAQQEASLSSQEQARVVDNHVAPTVAVEVDLLDPAVGDTAIPVAGPHLPEEGCLSINRVEHIQSAAELAYGHAVLVGGGDDMQDVITLDQLDAARAKAVQDGAQRQPVLQGLDAGTIGWPIAISVEACPYGPRCQGTTYLLDPHARLPQKKSVIPCSLLLGNGGCRPPGRGLVGIDLRRVCCRRRG